MDISRGLVPLNGEANTRGPRTVVFTTNGVSKVAATRPYASTNDVGLNEIEIRFANPMNTGSLEGLIAI